MLSVNCHEACSFIAPSHGGERSINWNLLARKIAREPLAAHTIPRYWVVPYRVARPTNQRLSLGGHRGVSVASRFVQRPALRMHYAYGIWHLADEAAWRCGFPCQVPGPNALRGTATQQPQNRHKRVRRPWVGADERLVEKSWETIRPFSNGVRPEAGLWSPAQSRVRQVDIKSLASKFSLMRAEPAARFATAC